MAETHDSAKSRIFEDDDKDDSSSLSEPDEDDIEDETTDARSTIQSRARKDDVDSEAETERLELTPRHMRDMAVAGIGRTPSKLSKVDQQEDELTEPPSPVPQGAGAVSSTSTLTNGGES